MCLGILGRVVEIPTDREDVALVDVSGATRLINIALLEDEVVAPGDWVMIHVGFALSTMSAEEVAHSVRMLDGVGQEYTDELIAQARPVDEPHGTR